MMMMINNFLLIFDLNFILYWGILQIIIVHVKIKKIDYGDKNEYFIFIFLHFKCTSVL